MKRRRILKILRGLILNLVQVVRPRIGQTGVTVKSGISHALRYRRENLKKIMKNFDVIFGRNFILSKITQHNKK